MINLGMLISDRYEIVDKVGTGGMADVYKAKDRRLNRFVAIKILKQEYSNDAKFVSKFRAEAQSVAGLSHPNIVNVYDVGEDGDLYYIVMELVEGITLKKFIETKGRLEIKEAVGIAIQIAQGMGEAHANHIIHRDIKPQNIIISKEGKVKVTDFGIAKAATSNTITSNAMGSVHYISPEQARGGYSDEKSDIYSLGITMYEMLSGAVPFEGDSTVTVALSHIQNEAVPLDEVDAQIPHSISLIVQKCMEKKPDYRYLSADALIADLKRALAEPDGAYVVMGAVAVDDSPTKPISKDELEEIKESARNVVPEKKEENVLPVIETDLEEEPEIDPKLEKILKVCSVVVAILLVIGILLIAGKFMGWFGSGGKDKDADSTPAVSAQAGQVEVPDIVGKTLQDAEEMLRNSGLQYQLEPQESNEEANKVLDQKPDAGEFVDSNSRVTIYYSKGDANSVAIPNVTNYAQADAEKALTDLGLVVGVVTQQASSTVDKGNVISTDPVVGSSVDKGSTVNIVISTGSDEDVVVPNLVGKKEAAAVEMLTKAGLSANDITYMPSDTVEKGKVISQDVAVGSMVASGSTVPFTVSSGPQKTTEPKPTPTEAPKEYSYHARVSVNSNPFGSADEDPATIKLVLTQDGTTKTVWTGTLGYGDFPKSFSIQGWSDNNGTVTVYKDDSDTGISLNVEFTKRAK